SQRGILNMAHQGGELEAPSSTMFAFRTAVRDRHADSLEMDIFTTGDDRLVVLHDDTVDRTTNGTGAVREMTLAEIQALDAAWWHSPGTGQYDHGLPPSSYPMRGIRTGDTAAPSGFTPEDFRIPTMEDVLDAFPDVPLNVDMKGTPGVGNGGEVMRTAEILAGLLNRDEYRDHPVIVASVDQSALDRFHELAPHVDVSASLSSMLRVLDGDWALEPRPVALQVPIVLGALDPPALLRQAGANDQGFAVHAWTDGSSAEHEGTYAHARDQGVQGIFTAAPTRLHEYLCRAGERRPDGSPRCASQRMKHRIGLPSRSLRKYLRKGLPVRLRCSQACRAQLEVRIRKPAARKLGIKGSPRPFDRGLVLIGTQKRIKGTPKPGLNIFRANAFRQAHRRLRRARKVRLELTIKVRDGADWESAVVRRWVTLKSPQVRSGRR
ncbi:MAG: hypothetical protein M3Y45_00430, partial [Actinomycetota bacterium]|nr:hypothetical protein [Actinomycetota bacterium]